MLQMKKSEKENTNSRFFVSYKNEERECNTNVKIVFTGSLFSIMYEGDEDRGVVTMDTVADS